MSARPGRPALLVLSSTYPRWKDDPEPGFVHELSKRLTADFDVIALVWLAGLAGVVDVVRFRNGWEWFGWCNMFLIWTFCHQLGYFYARLVRASRRVSWALLWAGCSRCSA